MGCEHQHSLCLTTYVPRAEPHQGWIILKETRTLENLTTCKECLTLTLSVPKDCRLNIDILSVRLEELFNREVFRDLCNGCPLEKV